MDVMTTSEQLRRQDRVLQGGRGKSRHYDDDAEDSGKMGHDQTLNEPINDGVHPWYVDAAQAPCTSCTLARRMLFQVTSAAVLKVLALIQHLNSSWQSSESRRPDGGLFFGSGDAQDTSTPAAIMAQAESFLSGSRQQGYTPEGQYYSFNMPSRQKYSPSQWLWDSGAHQIAWSALGRKDVAVADLRSMMHYLLPTGQIPEQINWRSSELSRFDRLKTLALYSRLEYADLTQTPVLPYSLRSIYNAASSDRENASYILREFLPKIVQYYEWLRTTRDLDGTGVLTILHPWESGLDLSPAYDAALQLDPSRQARPAWSDLYPSLIRLNMAYKHLFQWKQGNILKRQKSAATAAGSLGGALDWFKVQDVAFNCVYASGWGVLGELALASGDPELAATCKAHEEHAERGILTYLYSHDLGRFVTGWKRPSDNAQQYHPAKTVQILFPLLLSSISRTQVESIVDLLTDPAEFWTAFPVPSVSKSESSYHPVQDNDLLWRGPSWGFTNWFIMQGLAKQGLDKYSTTIHTLMDRWIAAVTKGGIYEMWNPETGESYGAEGLGMSCLIVDWMKRLDRV